MIRVELPYHLRNLAGIDGPEVVMEVEGVPTLASVLLALEAQYPTLRGTIRDTQTLQRRSMVRFFVCNADWSFESTDKPLPPRIVEGLEAVLVIGAISGG